MVCNERETIIGSICYLEMNRQKKQLFSPFFLLSVAILIPLLALGIQNGRKLLNIYIIHPNDYTITKARLLTNFHQKYNNHATYQFNYGGKMLDGSAGSILWDTVGEEITIYFETGHPENNGILNGLFFLTIGQWLTFIIFCAYVVYKTVRYIKTT